jgi:peptidoglycan/xylan/chitin deacetylase (PgdA/CDA1 family)
MRRRVLMLIAACFYYTGLVRLVRWIHQRAGKKLVILNYHRAAAGDLRRHLLYLRQHYRILHLEEALEELYSPRKEQEQIRDRRTPLVLTFDDGYHDNYTHGFALARKLQVPLTLFLIPGYIESGDYFWWREGKRLVRRAQVKEVTIEGRTYHLERSEEKRALAQAIDSHLRYARSVAEREVYLATVRNALAVPSNITVEEEAVLPLTWAQVHKMEETGWVSFGAHTMHHPILGYLENLQEVQREVRECRTILEKQLGHPVRMFAYPVGQLQHIGEDVLSIVQQAGYDWAVTTRYGLNTPRSNPYLLRRIEVDVDQHWLVVAAEAAGLWGFFSWLRWLPPIRKHFTNSR